MARGREILNKTFKCVILYGHFTNSLWTYHIIYKLVYSMFLSILNVIQATKYTQNVIDLCPELFERIV